jgi:FMN phosphatase YigB (HAD superfamily)
MKKINIVFFDIGGTLVGSHSMFTYLADKFGRKGDKSLEQFLAARFAEIYSNSNPPGFNTVVEMFAKLLKEASNKLGLADLSNHAKEFYHDMFVDKAWLLEGAKENLAFLKKNHVKLIVASDADSEVLFKELQLLKIYDFFDEFIVSNKVGAYKPSDLFVKEAKKHCTKFKKSSIYFVGDSKSDVMTAKKLGVNSILMSSSEKAKETEPDYVFNNLNELLVFWVKRLNITNKVVKSDKIK